MSDFQGLVALVTGGASGIGAATAVLTERGTRGAVLHRSTGLAMAASAGGFGPTDDRLRSSGVTMGARS